MTGQESPPGRHEELDRLGAEGSPLVIASILRPEGRTGVHTHVKEFQTFLNETGIPSTLVTPFSFTPRIERTRIRRALGFGAIQWIGKRRLVSLFPPGVLADGTSPVSPVCG